tara:strand:- start:1405 stop:1686 length:282 start_codon:yes stop_codon:yes gene_type:complete
MKDPISKWANEAQKRNKEDFAQMREAELARKDLLDEALDAMHELHMLKTQIEERLTFYREQITTYVDDNYDETVIARYDELAKLKYWIKKHKK